MAAPFLSRLPLAVEQALLAAGTIRGFGPGEVVLGEGDASYDVCFLLRGRVRVERRAAGGPAVALAELGPGEVAGEMGALTGEPRGASVVALGPAEMLHVGAFALGRVATTHPPLLEALEALAERRGRATAAVLQELARAPVGGAFCPACGREAAAYRGGAPCEVCGRPAQGCLPRAADEDPTGAMHKWFCRSCFSNLLDDAWPAQRAPLRARAPMLPPGADVTIRAS